jgi:5-methylcytosine-specific restriction enzyme subunit McrC
MKVLPNHFLDQKVFREHHGYFEKYKLKTVFSTLPQPILFNNDLEKVCFKVNNDGTISNGYFIGTDWLIPNQTAVFVEPKINEREDVQIDFLKMLFDAMSNNEVTEKVQSLYEIKWKELPIKINQNQDLISPFLVVQFLRTLKTIVQKGLKRSYYRKTYNLENKIKGKVLVAHTIKHNLVKHKKLSNICSVEEFGFNGFENRLLHKALEFCKSFSNNHPMLKQKIFVQELIGYCSPAFKSVSKEVDIAQVKKIRPNPFFTEYSYAIRLAKDLLRRFSYNINTTSNRIVAIPPFWIDMSKLFELYVYGKLKNKFPGSNEVVHEKYIGGRYPDFLLRSEKDSQYMVIDAKYKPGYSDRNIFIEDARQVSGYARMTQTYEHFNKSRPTISENELIKCLIIYSDQNEKSELNLEDRIHDPAYQDFYKLGISLPELKII